MFRHLNASLTSEEEEGMEIDSVSQPENTADAEWRFGADGVEAGRACAAEEHKCVRRRFHSIAVTFTPRTETLLAPALPTAARH